MTGPDVPRCDERGVAVSVWAVLLVWVILLCVGLAVDLGGQARATQTAYQAAGQAARAGAQALDTRSTRGQQPSVDALVAKAVARRELAAAGVGGEASITDGGRTLHVTTTVQYRTLFLGVIGIATLPAHGTADASLLRVLKGAPR